MCRKRPQKQALDAEDVFITLPSPDSLLPCPGYYHSQTYQQLPNQNHSLSHSTVAYWHPFYMTFKGACQWRIRASASTGIKVYCTGIVSGCLAWGWCLSLTSVFSACDSCSFKKPLHDHKGKSPVACSGASCSWKACEIFTHQCKTPHPQWKRSG